MLPTSESLAAAVSALNWQLAMHVLSVAHIALLQEQLSPVASRRQPWLVCCMTRQAAAEATSTLAGSACESGVHLLAVTCPGSASWSVGSHAWHWNTGASPYAGKLLTRCPAAVLQRTDPELGRLLQGLGEQQDSLQPLQAAVLREANR